MPHASPDPRQVRRPESSTAALFSHAFRPFFLAAGIYAVVALSAWLAWIMIHAAGAMPAFMTIAEPPHLWHAHEMIFGFAAAAAGGFMLTAVPSWTGAERSKGGELMAIFALWFAGRAAMWATALLPGIAAMAIDLLFLPVLGLAAARQLAVKPTRPNILFIALILVLVAANILFHLGRIDIVADGMGQGAVLGLGTLVVMITVIGGRVIPGFTTNALRRRGIETNLPQRRVSLDISCILLAVAVFALLALGASGVIIGIAALAAVPANALRLALWRTRETLREPILWVLHLGYAWIAVGFAVLAASSLLGWAGNAAAYHAFGTGAVGTMVLGIMSRAALGHTGRAIVAARPIIVAYYLVSAAAGLRTFGPMLAPGFYNEIMIAAGLAWIVAFLFFTIVYAPIMLKPRLCPGEAG